ncbi:MAG: RcnB family protein [Caulobacteraceae bacterium]
MKKLILGALALTTLVGGLGAGVANAQPRFDGRGAPAYASHDQHGFAGQRFGRGQRLPAAYRGRDRFVDYRSYRLRQPPRGYGWVRNDNQFLLVALTTGLIADAIANR